MSRTDVAAGHRAMSDRASRIGKPHSLEWGLAAAAASLRVSLALAGTDARRGLDVAPHLVLEKNGW